MLVGGGGDWTPPPHSISGGNAHTRLCFTWLDANFFSPILCKRIQIPDLYKSVKEDSMIHVFELVDDAPATLK